MLFRQNFAKVLKLFHNFFKNANNFLLLNSLQKTSPLSRENMVYRLAERGKLCLCPYLLPAIFYLTWIKHGTFQHVYNLSLWFMLGSLVHCTLNNFRCRPSKWNHLLILCLFSSVLQTLLSAKPWSFVFAFFFHSILLNLCLRYGHQTFPRSFSRCELTILSQGICAVVVHSVMCFFSTLVDSPHQSLCSSHLPTRIIQLLYFGSIVILAQPLLLCKYISNLNLNVYSAIVSGACFTYASLWQMMRSEPIIWLLNFLFHSEKSVHLMRIWSICILVCVVFAALFTKLSGVKANTILRKFYHLVIVLVFITGAKYDLNLLYFASNSALIILLLLEMVRLTRLPPLGNLIEKAFKQFRDEKDSGPLTLTHLYLLIGFSLPIWIVPELHNHTLIASGLITIGFGDTFASLIGYTFGKHRWPDSKKTYEGTIGALVAQIIGGMVFLTYVGLAWNLLLVLKLILISTTVSLVEAWTRQIDNLILPLYFHLIWLLLDLLST